MSDSPYALYVQAGGGTDAYSRERYLELLHDHGHVLKPGDEGYEQASATLPCGWPGPARPAAEWCIHELAPGTCSVCTGRGEELPPDHDRTSLGASFPARYPGRCAWGDERISEGDMIRSAGDGDYVCGRCSQ